MTEDVFGSERSDEPDRSGSGEGSSFDLLVHPKTAKTLAAALNDGADRVIRMRAEFARRGLSGPGSDLLGLGTLQPITVRTVEGYTFKFYIGFWRDDDDDS